VNLGNILNKYTSLSYHVRMLVHSAARTIIVPVPTSTSRGLSHDGPQPITKRAHGVQYGASF
jgi:hypothetical protein